MTRRPTALLAGLILGSFAAATVAWAQAPNASPPQPKGQDMMKGHGGMMMDHMDADHMKQMTRMMENCNRMMERAQEETKPDSQGTPPAKDK